MDTVKIIRGILQAYSNVHPKGLHDPSVRLEWRMNEATFRALATANNVPPEHFDFKHAELLGIPVNVTDTDQVNLVLRVA